MLEDKKIVDPLEDVLHFFREAGIAEDEKIGTARKKQAAVALQAAIVANTHRATVEAIQKLELKADDILCLKLRACASPRELLHATEFFEMKFKELTNRIVVVREGDVTFEVIKQEKTSDVKSCFGEEFSTDSTLCMTCDDKDGCCAIDSTPPC